MPLQNIRNKITRIFVSLINILFLKFKYFCTGKKFFYKFCYRESLRRYKPIALNACYSQIVLISTCFFIYPFFKKKKKLFYAQPLDVFSRRCYIFINKFKKFRFCTFFCLISNGSFNFRGCLKKLIYFRLQLDSLSPTSKRLSQI